MVGVSNEFEEKYIGYLNFRMVQHPVLDTDSYTREGICEVIALIGGFVGMMKNFSYLLLGSYQTFTIDKSMIKKIFSLRKPEQKELARMRAASSVNEIHLDQLDQKQDDLKYTIKNRYIFRNEYVTFRIETWKRLLSWFFCCFCYRVQPRASKDMRHF